MATQRILIAMKLEVRILPLIAQSNRIVAGVGDPAHAHWFPLPSPALATVSAAILVVERSQALVATRARGAAVARNAPVANLRSLLRSLAMYVQVVADANPVEAQAIIQASGFSERAVGRRTVPALAVTPGPHPGTAILKAKAGPKGRKVFYDHRYSLDGGSTWISGQGTTFATTTITGLPSVTVVAFQVRVSVGKVIGVWSQTVTVLVH